MKSNDLDFEISFLEGVLKHRPNYIDALAPLAEAYTRRGLFEKGLETCQKDLARFEKIKRFALLDHPLTQLGGDLTPTLKVKREVLFKKYQSVLESLYIDI